MAVRLSAFLQSNAEVSLVVHGNNFAYQSRLKLSSHDRDAFSTSSEEPPQKHDIRCVAFFVGLWLICIIAAQGCIDRRHVARNSWQTAAS